MQISDQLISFFSKFNNPPEDAMDLIKKSTYLLIYKGYGTPENEIKFMHDVFLYIRNLYPEFKTFSWEQYVSYNDNYDHFMLEEITVNGHLDPMGPDFHWDNESENSIPTNIYFYSALDPDPDELEFCKNNNLKSLKSQEDFNNFTTYFQKKYKHLEKPTLLFQMFLKLLEYKFSMYYFLYAFGNCTKVEFNETGVSLTKFENEYHGLGFYSDF